MVTQPMSGKICERWTSGCWSLRQKSMVKQNHPVQGGVFLKKMPRNNGTAKGKPVAAEQHQEKRAGFAGLGRTGGEGPEVFPGLCIECQHRMTVLRGHKDTAFISSRRSERCSLIDCPFQFETDGRSVDSGSGPPGIVPVGRPRAFCGLRALAGLFCRIAIRRSLFNGSYFRIIQILCSAL